MHIEHENVDPNTVQLGDLLAGQPTAVFSFQNCIYTSVGVPFGQITRNETKFTTLIWQSGVVPVFNLKSHTICGIHHTERVQPEDARVIISGPEPRSKKR